MSQPTRPTRPPQAVRRPGDRVVRRAVLRTETVKLRPPRPPRRGRPIALTLVYGFIGLITLGTALLSLPVATVSGERAPLVDALFTATSAVCVTGLVVQDTGTYWSHFGQAVILLLIQAGGFGFATSATLLLVTIGHRATLRERLACGFSLGADTTASGEILRLVRRLAVVTVLIELAGALLLLPRALYFHPPGHAIWWSLFHSVSAFNNAGFDITGGYRSLTPYQRDPWILLTIGLLIVLGGLSFVVLADIVAERRWRRLTVDSKLVLTTTGFLLFIGMVAFLLLESGNPATLGRLDWGSRLLNALFHSITPRTAGFNAVDLSALREETLFLLTALMFIGGASGSTAGGIKVQTFSLLFFAIIASVQGHSRVVAFGREVPHVQVYRALAVALLSIAVVFSVALTLALTIETRFIDVWFEAVSAFGTVGLSTGITPELNTVGRLILIVTMFVGRLGPLTLALALAARTRPSPVRYAPETVRLG